MSDKALRIAIVGEVACGPKAAARARRQAVALADLRARIEKGEPVVVLDVRESAAAPLDNGEGVSIPLSKLRERSSEPPSDRQVVHPDDRMRAFSAVGGGGF